MNKAAFESRVMEILRENAASKWRRHREDGHLDPRSLHEYRTTPDIWRLKEVAGSRKYSATFMIDMSGSMGGHRADSAKTMAAKFADSMHVLGIPFAIWAFGNCPVKVHGFSDYYSRPRLQARLDATYKGQPFAIDGNFDLVVERSSSYWRPQLEPMVEEGKIKDLKGGDVNLLGGTNPALVQALAISDAMQLDAEPLVILMSDGEIGCDNSYSYYPFMDIKRAAPASRAYHQYANRFVESLAKAGFRMDNSFAHRFEPGLKGKFSGEDLVKPLEKHLKTGPYGSILVGLEGSDQWDNQIDLNAVYNHFLVKEVLGGQFLFMGIQNDSFFQMSKCGLIPESDVFSVHNLAQGYDAIVAKLSSNFRFDYGKKLR